MAIVSLKMTTEESDLLTALLQCGHGDSRSQILRDALLDFSERYMDVERLRRIALHARQYYRPRKSRVKQPTERPRARAPKSNAPAEPPAPQSLLSVMFAEASSESLS